MKVKELPNTANLQKIKIKLTPSLRQAYKEYCSKGEEEVYIVGECMGDFFISPDIPEKKQRRLYPMPIEITPQDFLECEVIK